MHDDTVRIRDERRARMRGRTLPANVLDQEEDLLVVQRRAKRRHFGVGYAIFDRIRDSRVVDAIQPCGVEQIRRASRGLTGAVTASAVLGPQQRAGRRTGVRTAAPLRRRRGGGPSTALAVTA